MTTATSFTPVSHHVYNAFDEAGLLLGLPRLKDEQNPEYKQRLLDVFVHRANSTYTGLVNGITRELGLDFYDALTITCATDANGAYLLTNPGVTFKDNFCYLVSNMDPQNYTIYLSIDRYDRTTSGAWTLKNLIDTINATPYFTATIATDADPYGRSMCVFNQTSYILVPYENISKAGTQIKLDNEDLIEGTVAVQSANLRERVSSQINLLYNGQYYLDLEAGMLYCVESPAAGSVIRYYYRENPMLFKASPVILNDLQSVNFQKKLFEQIVDELSVEHNGIPSVLGLDILNELYSVSSVFWNK